MLVRRYVRVNSQTTDGVLGDGSAASDASLAARGGAAGERSGLHRRKGGATPNRAAPIMLELDELGQGAGPGVGRAPGGGRGVGFAAAASAVSASEAASDREDSDESEDSDGSEQETIAPTEASAKTGQSGATSVAIPKGVFARAPTPPRAKPAGAKPLSVHVPLGSSTQAVGFTASMQASPVGSINPSLCRSCASYVGEVCFRTLRRAHPLIRRS